MGVGRNGQDSEESNGVIPRLHGHIIEFGEWVRGTPWREQAARIVAL